MDSCFRTMNEDMASNSALNETAKEGEMSSDRKRVDEAATGNLSVDKNSPKEGDKSVEDDDEDGEVDGSSSDSDDDDEADEGHSQLIITERSSHAPPKSAALLSSENDVFAFQSSPEDEPTSSSVRKHKKSSPSAGSKKANEKVNIDDDDEESKLQIDEEDETMDADEAESKKVPPLRILLPATKASDEEEQPPAEEEEKVEEKPTPTKKPARGKKAEGKTNPNRMTRSRLRQATEDGGTPAKRRAYGRVGSTLIANPDLEFEDFGLSPGLGVDEDSQECQTRKLLPPAPHPVRAWDLVQEGFHKGRSGLKKLIEDRYRHQHARSIELRPSEPEIPNYDLFMINVRDYLLSDTFERIPERPMVSAAPPTWRKEVRKLWRKHEKARKYKEVEHEKERVRLQTFGEREYLRAARSTILRERLEVSVLQMLRDEDVCNPIIFDSFRPEPETPSLIPETVESVIDKMVKMAETLGNKHVTEIKTMHCLQKLEMEECLRVYGYLDMNQEIPSAAVPKNRLEIVNFDYLVPIDSVEVSKLDPVLPPPEIIQKYGLDDDKIAEFHHETAHLIPTD